MGHFDALVIGQGLAGSILCRLLDGMGLTYMVIDEDRPQTSSKIAAGLVNPITGRRFAMSWKFPQLNEEARKFYRDWEDEIDVDLIYEMPIVRAMEDRRFIDDVEAKTADDFYRTFIESTFIDSSHYLKPAEVLYKINQAYRVDIQLLLEITKERLLREKRIQLLKFDYGKLILDSEVVRYENITADRVFFCEGSGVVHNPFFNYLPFQPTKGELFVLQQENPHPYAYKQDLLLIPFSDDALWCGSLNFWDYDEEQPTDKGETILLQKLRKIYTPDPFIKDHLAAIRPTTKDRRPMIGVHPQHRLLSIFNGLGTKGTLLGPFFGKQLLDSIYNQGDLMSQSSIERYSNF